MAQQKVVFPNFNLISKYSCKRTRLLGFEDDGDEIVRNDSYSTGTSQASEASKTVTFEYNLPNDAVVKSAKVFATIGSPLSGAAVSTINGVEVGYKTTAEVDVTLADGSNSIAVPFVFKSHSIYHEHAEGSARTSYYDEWKEVNADNPPQEGVARYCYRHYTTDHECSLNYSDVYLLIEYESASASDPGTGEEEGDTGGEGGTGTGAEDSENTTESGTIAKKITSSSLTLNSSFPCVFQDVYFLTAAGTVIDHETREYVYDASTDYRSVEFELDLPTGAIVKSAKVHAKFGSGKCKKERLTIAGTSAGYGMEVDVPVSVTGNTRSVSVGFSYKCVERYTDPGNLADCFTSETWQYEVPEYNNCNIQYFTDRGNDTSSVRVSDLYLTVEYTMPAVGWSIVDSKVEPNEELTVVLDKTVEGFSYTMQVAFGGEETEEISIPVDTMTASVTLPESWIYLMTDSATAVGTVTVREYFEGEVITATAKPFTLVCPESCVPSVGLVDVEPLLTVDGVTYPEVYPGVYVQGKCGARITGNVSANYGASVASVDIDVADGRYKLTTDESSFALDSGLLTSSGFTDIVVIVTDSRGRSAGKRMQIYVEPYSSPSAQSFTVYRADANYGKDESSPYVMYSFNPVYSRLDGHNSLTISLSADGIVQRHTGDTYKGYLMGASGAIREFEGATLLSVELILTDAYGSKSFYATILPLTGVTVVVRPTRKKKRGLIIGDYDTVLDGDWTMSALSLTNPEQQTNLVTVPGRAKGPLDLSTALTDGEPIYGARTLSATLENSNGTRQERTDLITKIVNQLNGRRWEIIHPDYPDHYLVGRVSVAPLYNDMAHCAVSVTAVCEPWKYSKMESSYEWGGLLYNGGSMTVVPKITIVGGDGSALLTCLDRGVSRYLSAGTYVIPELALHPGEVLDVTVQDFSSPFFGTRVEECTVTYREAVL